MDRGWGEEVKESDMHYAPMRERHNVAKIRFLKKCRLVTKFLNFHLYNVIVQGDKTGCRTRNGGKLRNS